MATSAMAPGGMEWRVRRLLLPPWMRPVGLRAASEPYSSSTSPLGPAGLQGFAGFAMAFGALWFIVTSPLLPLLFFLRRRGILPWTIEAVARPWGRMGPPIVLRYEVRGSTACTEAMAELVAALERGDGAPVVSGAERVET